MFTCPSLPDVYCDHDRSPSAGWVFSLRSLFLFPLMETAWATPQISAERRVDLALSEGLSASLLVSLHTKRNILSRAAIHISLTERGNWTGSLRMWRRASFLYACRGEGGHVCTQRENKFGKRTVQKTNKNIYIIQAHKSAAHMPTCRRMAPPPCVQIDSLGEEE